MTRSKMTILFCFILGINVSFAQDQKRTERIEPTEIATIQTNKMVNNYGLNDAQKSQVYAINLRTANQIEAVKKNNKLEKAAIQIKKNEILVNQRVSINKVLTQSQRAKFNEDNAKYDAKKQKN
jgi:Spy/CpxP family protein refolding chaperone